MCKFMQRMHFAFCRGRGPPARPRARRSFWRTIRPRHRQASAALPPVLVSLCSLRALCSAPGCRRARPAPSLACACWPPATPPARASATPWSCKLTPRRASPMGFRSTRVVDRSPSSPNRSRIGRWMEMKPFIKAAPERRMAPAALRKGCSGRAGSPPWCRRSPASPGPPGKRPRILCSRKLP